MDMSRESGEMERKGRGLKGFPVPEDEMCVVAPQLVLLFVHLFRESSHRKHKVSHGRRGLGASTSFNTNVRRKKKLILI